MIRFLPFETNSMKAFEGENEVGYCSFSIDGFVMTFNSLVAENNDPIITEGLIRSAMNYAANRGAYISKVEKGISQKMFEFLEFKGDEVLSAEIPEVLTSGCGCSHNK